MIKKYIYSLNLRKILLIILLFSFLIPSIQAFSLFSINIRPYRIISLLMFVALFFKRNTIFVPSKKLLIFLFYMICISVIASFNLGFDRLILDYIFAYCIIVIVYNYGKDIKYEEWMSIFQYAALFIITLVLTNVILQKDSWIAFLSNPINQHPNYESIFPGGLNLDSTWVALFSLFFLKKPFKGYVYLIISMFISMVLSSRVGMIIDIMALIIIFINQMVHLDTKRRKLVIILFVSFLIAISLALFSMNIPNKIISRFTEIGTDGGSQGRLHIWKNVINGFIKYPFGCGVGNAMKMLKSTTKLWFDEDNTHNIYFQMLLDTGFIGLGYFIYLIALFIRKNKKNIFKISFFIFILFYFIIGLIQFKGAEIIVYYVLGVCLLLERKDFYEEKN